MVCQLLRRRRFLIGLAVTLGIGLVFCLAFGLNLLYGWQQQGSDLYFRAANLYQEKEPEEKVVIVGIDDRSLEKLGHFSLWPRSYYAQLINKLTEAKARVVVFDILFAEPTSADEELAKAIKNAGNIILPVIYTVPQQTARPESLIKPLPIFEAGAAALGHANVTADADGVVRRLSIAIGSGSDYEPALALAAVAKYLRRPEVIESPIKDSALPFAGRLIPLIDNNEMLINYLSSPPGSGGIASFETVSFVDVINGEAAPALFQDRIVIIGATASGLGDTFWTPMGQMRLGVEIHASAVHTILSGNFLKPAPSIVTIVTMLVVALLCGLAVLRLRVLWASLSAAFLCLAYFLVAFSLFDRGIMLNMLYPPLTTIGAFVGLNVYNVTRERSEKGKIIKTFGRYISTPVADRILAALDEGKLKLGGEGHEVSVAFADVRGFTGIAERMPPEELVRVLNAYLSLVIKSVLKYEGMINKFGGDSITAIWNVPTGCEGHSLLAVKAALEAQRAIKEFQREATLPRMDFGMGINTGRAVAGNMGSEDRLEYSVIGDTVNIAARLASAAPGGKVWIGANTFSLVKDYVKAKPLRPLAVKGKRKPVIAYEVVAIKSW